MKSKHLIFYIYFIICLSNCTVGIPLMTSAAGQIRSADEKFLEVRNFDRGDKIQITTKNYQNYIGEVLFFEPLSPKYTLITKALHQRIETELNLQKNDTLSIFTNQNAFNGIFRKFDNRRLVLIDNFGKQQIIPWEKVIGLFINGNSVPKEKISSIKASKFEEKYKIKIKTKKGDFVFHSDNILRIETLVSPHNRKSLLLSAALGLVIDIYIIFSNFGPYILS